MVTISKSASFLTQVGAVSGSVADQDAVWGATASIDAAGGSTGTYAATGLPFGVTINATTGLIGGTAFIARSRSTVTVTRNAVTIHTFQLGVTFLSGTSAVVAGQDHLNLYADGLTPYDTTNAATSSALISAMIARVNADTDPLVGAGNTCVREIVWTGGDILKNTSINTYFADMTPQTWNDRLIIVIDGQGALCGQVVIRYKGVRIVWKNWKFTGLNTGATRNPFYNEVLGSKHFLFNCKVGPYFHPDSTDWGDFQNNSSAMMRYLGGRTAMGAAYCHFAGWQSGCVWENYGIAIYDIENMFSHFGEDVMRLFNAPADGNIYIHRRGSISTRQINFNALIHSDVIQYGAQQANGAVFTLDDEACLADGGCGRVTQTYSRQQKENGWTAEFNTRIKDAVIRTNAYDAFVNGDEYMEIDGMVCSPPPGLPLVGTRITLNFNERGTLPGPAVVRDVRVSSLTLQGNWATSGMTLTGTSATYDRTSEASIETMFPGTTGAFQTLDRMQNVYGASYYVADYQPFAMHPASIRAAFSAQAMPNGGWAASGCKDPATVPINSVWGSAPSGAVPSVTLALVVDTMISLTLPGPGIVYYLLDTRNDPPSPPHLMSGVEAKGSFSGPSDQGDLGSTVSEWNRKRFTAGGAQTITLTGTRAAGTHYCYLVFEDAVTGVLSLVKPGNFTK